MAQPDNGHFNRLNYPCQAPELRHNYCYQKGGQHDTEQHARIHRGSTRALSPWVEEGSMARFWTKSPRSSVVIDRQLLGCSVVAVSQGQAKGVGVLDGMELLSELAGLILRNSMK